MNGYSLSPRPGQLVDDLEVKAQLARISLLGHDLRAAVSDILGGLQLISDTDVAQPARVQMERVRVAGESLARLLTDGLDLATSQTLAPLRQSLQLSALLHDVEKRWSGHAQEKGLRFHIALAPDVPLLVRLERLAVERVLSNMISNAFKHANRGAVRLIVACEGESELAFSVLDDGPGFDSALGVRFCAPGSRGSSGIAGEGLGLFIAREMALRLGGWLALSNRAEGGACVCLTVPLRAVEPPEPLPAPLPDLSLHHVLIVDDSAVNRALLQHMLALMGAECDCASDGVEALERLRQRRYDLMVLDIELPRLSGLEVLRQIRAPNGLPEHLPVVACTAHVQRASREAICAAGANAMLRKPLDGLQNLAAAIVIALEQSSSISSTEATEHAFSSLIATLGTETRAEVAALLLADLGRIERGLVVSLSQGNLRQVQIESHALVSIAGSVGAEPLHRLAQHLFDAAGRGDLAATLPLGAQVLALTEHLIQFARQHGATPLPARCTP